MSVPNHVKYLILGAGPTGLGAAYRLRELGIEQFAVIDRASTPGGLAASFADDRGFTWDIGGHVLFSHYDYCDTLMDRALGTEGWWHHQRESWIWMQNRFIPYPLQNNIHRLPREAMLKCIGGLARAYRMSGNEPAHFGDWMTATFGEELSAIFLRPYNFKVWAYPPEMMHFGWVGERVAIPDLARITENIALERDDVSWGPNSTFRFPSRGGTGAIWLSVASLIGIDHLAMDRCVVSIDTQRRVVTTHNGEQWPYEVLISTIPLDTLTRIWKQCPADVATAAERLRYSSSNIVGIGLHGRMPEHLRGKCWMYFPEDTSPFYRVTVFSHYSPANVPDGEYWSLMAEVSESSYRPVSQETVVEEVIQGLLNTRLVGSRDDVASLWHYRAEHGYPTPTLDRDTLLRQIHPRLEQAGIYSRGRFGGWKYEVSNQDHSVMQGVELINRLVLRIPEVTYPFPNTANANWGRGL